MNWALPEQKISYFSFSSRIVDVDQLGLVQGDLIRVDGFDIDFFIQGPKEIEMITADPSLDEKSGGNWFEELKARRVSFKKIARSWVDERGSRKTSDINYFNYFHMLMTINDRTPFIEADDIEKLTRFIDAARKNPEMQPVCNSLLGTIATRLPKLKGSWYKSLTSETEVFCIKRSQIGNPLFSAVIIKADDADLEAGNLVFNKLKADGFVPMNLSDYIK